MEKIKTVLTLLIFLLFTACQKDNLYNDLNSGDAMLTINLNPTNNQLSSRAVSGENDEKTIFNAYVFIFNSEGEKLYGKFYGGLNKISTITINDIKQILGGSGMTVAVVVNVDNSIFNASRTDFDAINTKNELLNFVASINDNVIERGTSFLMSGIDENVSLTNKTNSVNIPLYRLDAKIRFDIKTYVPTEDGEYPVSFTPTEWRVVSVPLRARLFPNSSIKNQFANDPKNYFASEWRNFETLSDRPSGVTGTFAFYALESILTAKKEIPTDGLTDIQRYALRDKNLKNSDGTNRLEFEYANDAATYVEFKGNIQYRLNSTQVLSADVKYIVHLGGGVSDVNNYSNERNVHYTYNVTVKSVDQIDIEVTRDEENRPGAAGNIAVANEIIDLDAYNNIKTLHFASTSIGKNLTWDVSTPFSKGNAIANPKDYEWVLFRIGKKNTNKTAYVENFNLYLGDGSDKRYPDVLDANNVSDFLDQYIIDIANNNDKMLDVKQLVEVLKECKRRQPDGLSYNTLFLSKNIAFTAYIKEYYYDVNPENTSETAENGLWKKFVNKDIRVLNILSDYELSSDKQSSKSVAEYSIRQASIQTMYNLKSTENYTGWGSQFYPNDVIEGRAFAASGETTSTNANADGQKNGRRNFANFFPNNPFWNTYLNLNTWQNVTNYNYAKYKCLNRNRDMNGDGKIQQEEVQWYLASINQLTDLWIGEDSFHPTSKLYQYDTWELTKQHYVSSSILDANNPEVLWAAEGSSVGRLNNSGATQLYYRCVRNLGVPNNAPIDVNPDQIYTYVAPYRTGSIFSYKYNNGFIDLSRLDSKSIRGFYTVEELPDHELRDSRGYNKPYKKFEIMYDTYGSGLSWETVRGRSQPGGNNSVCPDGWRVPTQRELSIMFSLMKNISEGVSGKDKYFKAWPINGDHFSRTGFNKVWTTERPGFAVTNDGGVLYMISGINGGSGGVRCVRDVK